VLDGGMRSEPDVLSRRRSPSRAAIAIALVRHSGSPQVPLNRLAVRTSFDHPCDSIRVPGPQSKNNIKPRLNAIQSLITGKAAIYDLATVADTIGDAA
jgi:hypothetical protein